MTSHPKELKLSQKLELLVALFNRKPLRPILDTFSTPQLVEAHTFLWDKMVEFHVKTQTREFRREEVTKKMIPSAKYQRMQGCDLRIDYCKGVECIWSNPVCAGNKVKNNMEVMAQHILGYLDTEGRGQPATRLHESEANGLQKIERSKEEVQARPI